MKKQLLLLPLLMLMASCGETPTSECSCPSACSATTVEATTVEETTVEVTTEEESSVEETTEASTCPIEEKDEDLEEALAALKRAYTVDIVVDTGSPSGVEYSMIFDGPTYMFKAANLKFSMLGEISGIGDPTYYYCDTTGTYAYAVYSEVLENDNTIGKEYVINDGSYIDFTAQWLNPFEMLSADQMTYNNGKYRVSDGLARLFVNQFVSGVGQFSYAYFDTDDNNIINSFVMGFEGTGTITVNFKEMGDEVEFTHAVTPVEDDGTDKTALATAIQNLGKNYTYNYTYVNNKAFFYATGSEIVYDYGKDGLSSQDAYYYFASTTSKYMNRKVYDSISDPAWSADNYTNMIYSNNLTYDGVMMDLANTSLAFFHKESDTLYTAVGGAISQVFAACQPYEIRRQEYCDNAESVKIYLTEDGNIEKINFVYRQYSYSGTSYNTIDCNAIFTNVGTTTIPEEYSTSLNA